MTINDAAEVLSRVKDCLKPALIVASSLGLHLRVVRLHLLHQLLLFHLVVRLGSSFPKAHADRALGESQVFAHLDVADVRARAPYFVEVGEVARMRSRPLVMIIQTFHRSDKTQAQLLRQQTVNGPIPLTFC